MRWCYPLLRPIRIIIAVTSLYCFVTVSIGKKVSQDNQPVSTANSTTSSLATEDFFQDSAHFGINITALINTILVLYHPWSVYWWLSTPFRRMLFALTLSSLAQVYGIRQFVLIFNDHTSCNDPFFDNTRLRCQIQYGVSGCELFWSVLVVMEAIISILITRDKKWLEQTAEEELRTAVMYRPDITLEVRDNSNTSGGVIELTSIPGQLEASGWVVEEVEEQLPEYTRRRNRDQPMIIDAMNPPERLAGAVARRLQSEGVSGSSNDHTAIEPSTSLPLPPPTISHITNIPQRESTDISIDDLLPPPSYKP
ncbi:hypothetical protein BGZ49_000863 [Haplosporangium sp. Z 27]|nr:hypothetical protein BGZ49_000863 [Haplosporangium sp. Z 27]